MNGYFERQLAVIAGSLRSLDGAEFERLAGQCELAVRGGGKVIASGLGKNVPICEKFVGTLASLGIPAAFLHTNSAMHGDLGLVRDGDLLLLLSKSGETEESVGLARHVLQRRAEAWLISFEAGSRLGRMMGNKLILSLESEGDEWGLVPNNSASVYLILLQGLAMQLASRLGVTLEVFERNHPGGAIGAQARSR